MRRADLSGVPTARNKPIRPVLAAEAEVLRQIAAQVDELGDIDQKLAPFRSLIAREIALRSALRSAYATKEASQTFEARGSRFVALIGAKGNERSINYPKLWRLGGVALMKRIATVTLKALEEHAPAIALDVVSFAATGPRSLRLMQLGNDSRIA